MVQKKGSDTVAKRNRKTVRVKTARSRSLSSTRWLERQLNDPYVAQAKQDGYRSRAVYKLKEMNEKFKLVSPGNTVVDLGAAPGGWLQYLSKKYADNARTRLIGIDLLEMEPIEQVTLLQGDFLDEETFKKLMEIAGKGGVDVVLSDMASSASGHAQTDHIRIMHLCEMALDFALRVLKPEGNFCAKVLRGGTENQLLAEMKRHFREVKHVKPAASRQDSAEMYVIAKGFTGENRLD